MIPPSTPILAALDALPLSAAERAALIAALPPACRTAHDLVHVIRRGEVSISRRLAKAIVKALEAA